MFYALGFGVVAGISLVSLPFTTLILNPRNFGEFALIGSIVSAVQGTFGSATGYYINGHYTQATVTDRPSIVTTVIIVSLFLATIGAMVVYFLLAIVPSYFGGFSYSLCLYALLAATVIPMALWTSTSQMMLLDERVALFAAGTVISPLAAAITTIALIFTTALRTEAMIIGMIVGAASSGLFSIAWLVRRASLNISSDATKRIARLIPVAFSGNGIEAFTPALERSLLADTVSTQALGLYAHSQTYSNVVRRLMKSAAHATFPTSLREAAEDPPEFPRTRRVWSAIHFAACAVTIGFVFFGEALISILTHGKFIAAHPYACLLLVCVNLQFLGRQTNAYLFGHGRTQVVSAMNLVAGVLALGLLSVFIPLFGVYGAIGAVAARVVVHRVGLLIFGWRLGIKEDLLLVIGILTSVLAIVVNEVFEPDALWSAAAFFAFLMAWAIVARHGVRNAIRLVRPRPA